MSYLATFPHLHLLVSGGNSQIIYLQSWQNWQIIGQTLDDAAGECLDKIGRMIGLDYPGGVNLAKIAGTVDENSLQFPIGMQNQKKILKNQKSTQNKIGEKLELETKNLKTRKLNSFLQAGKSLSNHTQNQTQNSQINIIQRESEENKKKQLSFEVDQIWQKNDLEQRQQMKKMETLNLNYSFSGIKTAVRYFVQKQKFVNWEFEKKLTKNENLILQNWQEIQTFVNQKQKKSNQNLETLTTFNKTNSKNQLTEEENNQQTKIFTIAKRYIQNLQEKHAELKICTKTANLKTKKNDFKQFVKKVDLIEDNLAKDEMENKQILELFWQELQTEIQTENWQKLELFYQICISAQSAVTGQLITKLELAIEVLKPKSLGISGGVSANLLLRQKIQNLVKNEQMELFIPIQSLTGDNATMIAIAGLADIWAENSQNLTRN